jgi:hypothetical protein
VGLTGPTQPPRTRHQKHLPATMDVLARGLKSVLPDCYPASNARTERHQRFQGQKMAATFLTVAELFRKANLALHGPVRWNTPIPDKHPGVYVIGLSADANASSSEIDAEYLGVPERLRWIANQPIVYIGQATRQTLATRLGQFYRHKYGAKSPHRGGQALKLLTCDLWVYWSPCDNPRGCESLMLDAFQKQSGQLPFANRK